MEGYLYLKVGRSFVHTYVVLEGQQLQYYDSVDVEKQKFKGSRGVQSVSDVEVVPVKEPNRKFCLGILYPDGVITILDCEQRNMRKLWIDSIRDASLLHIKLHEIQSNLSVFRNRLGLHPDHMSSRSQIQDAYIVACLDAIKNAPYNPKNKKNYKPFDNYELIHNNTFDVFNRVHRKGLDKETIQVLHMAKEAKDALLIVEDDAYKRRVGTVIDYEVIIVKGRDGVGLGIEVEESEFLPTPRLEVVGVSDSLHVLGYSEEAQGEIKIGDVLIGIDHDNCTDWPLSRVCARLGTLRLPPGHSTTLTFERVIPTPQPPSWTPRDADKYDEYYSQTQIQAHLGSSNKKDKDEEVNNKQKTKKEKEVQKRMKEEKKKKKENTLSNNSGGNADNVVYDEEYQRTLNSLRHPLPQEVQDRVDATINYAQNLSSSNTSTGDHGLLVEHGTSSSNNSNSKVSLNLSHNITNNITNSNRTSSLIANEGMGSLADLRRELTNMRIQLTNATDDIKLKQNFERQKKEEESREYESRIKRLNIRIASLEHMLAKESLLNVVSTIDSVTNPQDNLIYRLKQHEQEQIQKEKLYKEVLACDQMSQISVSSTQSDNRIGTVNDSISGNSSRGSRSIPNHTVAKSDMKDSVVRSRDGSTGIRVDPELMYDWLEEDEDVDQLSNMVEEEHIVKIAETALRAGVAQKLKELTGVAAGATSTGAMRPIIRPLRSPSNPPSNVANTSNTSNTRTHTTTDQLNLHSFNVFDSPHRYSQKKKQQRQPQYKHSNQHEEGLQPITLYRL